MVLNRITSEVQKERIACMLDNIGYWVWLNVLPGIGARKGAQLLEHFKCPEGIWEASEQELKRLPFLSEINIKQLLEKEHRRNLDIVLEKIRNANVEIVTINEDLYPYYLKNTYDPPLVLYLRGKLLKDEKMIGVVGSRKASSYGLNMAEKISQELAAAGISVVSGMARGADSCAHKGALKENGRTVAVLGCGPDIIYPAENKGLMDKIISSGAVISEYAPGTPPTPLNFPARNRIISGMSLGVVVVEANEKSGSLITANFALEQGREVFAIPGNINSINSKGTNKLIKEGAKIVTCIEDIIEELCLFSGVKRKAVENRIEIRQQIKLAGLGSDECRIAELLNSEAVHIDQLALKSGFSVQMVSSILIMLELNGLVEQLPGKIFKLRE